MAENTSTTTETTPAGGHAMEDTADAPWTVVKSNDKKRARLEAIRHVLHTLPYPDKDERIVHRPDPHICAPATELFETGEESGGSFPRVR